WQAGLFLAFLLAIGLAVLLQFNLFAIILGAASLVIVFAYPLMKRITHWPQLVLGLAFNWGALLGWAAVRGDLGSWAPFCLYAAGILWTLGYDTIYAHQDKADDIAVGVKSTALLFGSRSRLWVGSFYAVTVLGVLVAFRLAHAGSWAYIAWLAVIAHFVWQVWTWKMDDQVDCLAKFKSNRDAGLIIAIGCLLAAH
ncbi:MAG TPA: UbiA family prenyltransferase, partial [Stellaceae bacterium]|nr:UbiA family prenyltransferase [Stellaceae bacterium]